MLSAGTAASWVSSSFRSVARADLGFAVGQAEDEVAEANLLDQDAAQIAQQGGRTLLQEAESLPMRALHELRAAGLQHDGHVGHEVAHHARQLETGFGRQLAAARKLHVRHHGQQVVAVFHHLRAPRPRSWRQSRILGRARMRTSLWATLMPSLSRRRDWLMSSV